MNGGVIDVTISMYFRGNDWFYWTFGDDGGDAVMQTYSYSTSNTINANRELGQSE